MNIIFLLGAAVLTAFLSLALSSIYGAIKKVSSDISSLSAKMDVIREYQNQRIDAVYIEVIKILKDKE